MTDQPSKILKKRLTKGISKLKNSLKIQNHHHRSNSMIPESSDDEDDTVSISSSVSVSKTFKDTKKSIKTKLKLSFNISPENLFDDDDSLHEILSTPVSSSIVFDRPLFSSNRSRRTSESNKSSKLANSDSQDQLVNQTYPNGYHNSYHNRYQSLPVKDIDHEHLEISRKNSTSLGTVHEIDAFNPSNVPCEPYKPAFILGSTPSEKDTFSNENLLNSSSSLNSTQSVGNQHFGNNSRGFNRTGSNLYKVSPNSEKEKTMDCNILLLGGKESGKSTLFNQMKILYDGGFSDSERKKKRHVIMVNTLQAIQVLIQFVVTSMGGFVKTESEDEENNEQTQNPKNIENKYSENKYTGLDQFLGNDDESDEKLLSQIKMVSAAKIETASFKPHRRQSFTKNSSNPFQQLPETSFHPPLPPVYFDAIKTIWNHKKTQKAFEQRNEIGLVDSIGYFLDKVDEISKANYLPCDKDILHCHESTTGIHEKQFDTGFSINTRFFDVGGRRDRRKSWIQCFHNVSAFIFVASCSSYDRYLDEDKNVNRLRDAIDLFRQVWRNKWLANALPILFLNKQDLLKQKVISDENSTSIEKYFPEFRNYARDENNKYLRAKNFIKDQFLQAINMRRKPPTISAISEDQVEDSVQPLPRISTRFATRQRKLSQIRLIRDGCPWSTSNAVIKHRSSFDQRICYTHFTNAVETESLGEVLRDCYGILEMNLDEYGLI